MIAAIISGLFAVAAWVGVAVSRHHMRRTEAVLADIRAAAADLQR